MRWRNRKQSSNVDDRRHYRGAGGGGYWVVDEQAYDEQAAFIKTVLADTE